MTIEEARALRNGVYRLFWGLTFYSVASVGRLHDGTPWFAPANWTGAGRMEASTDWDGIERVELIELAPNGRDMRRLLEEGELAKLDEESKG